MSIRSGVTPVLVASMIVLAACNTPPPKAWLRYEPSGAHSWRQTPDGQLEIEALGAKVSVDLNRTDTRIELAVRNSTGVDLTFRTGPAASETPSSAIGEIQRKPLEPGRGEEVQDYQPYLSMQDVEVRSGWQTTFYLDSPLGRDPVLGQYFVLMLEARDAAGHRERHTLPLVATNSGKSAVRD